MDRFDLEQAILAAWGTKDDINLVLTTIFDGPGPVTEDELANMLIGISTLHQARCERLFNIFEQLIPHMSSTQDE